MTTYPVSLVLKDRAVLVVGGGIVATRKVRGLLPTQASITVVAPVITESLQTLVKKGHCVWRPQNYEATDLEGADIVFVATDDESTNAQVYEDASRAHLLINVADRPELCTFFLPSIARRGKLSIAVSTEGASPLSARKLRDECAALIPNHFEDYLEVLAAWRPHVIATLPQEHDRYQFWEQATDGRVLAFISNNNEAAAGALLAEILSNMSAHADTTTG